MIHRLLSIFFDIKWSRTHATWCVIEFLPVKRPIIRPADNLGCCITWIFFVIRILAFARINSTELITMSIAMKYMVVEVAMCILSFVKVLSTSILHTINAMIELTMVMVLIISFYVLFLAKNSKITSKIISAFLPEFTFMHTSLLHLIILRSLTSFYLLLTIGANLGARIIWRIQITRFTTSVSTCMLIYLLINNLLPLLSRSIISTIVLLIFILAWVNEFSRVIIWVTLAYIGSIAHWKVLLILSRGLCFWIWELFIVNSSNSSLNWGLNWLLNFCL